MVVDSADTDRLDIARTELRNVLDNLDLANAVFLIFANKQDLKSALTATELSESLALHQIRSHDWHIQPCSAVTGDGLYEGLDWVTSKLQSQREMKTAF
jgi:ADP-ribosylation factor-like protein 5B